MRVLPLIAFAAIAACGTDSPSDGLWTVVAIDGRTARGFSVEIREGRVAGGRDGCNDWSWDERTTDQGRGERMIVTHLVGCEETPEQRAYWAVTRGKLEPAALLRPDGSLLLTGGGHRLVARRTKR